MLCESLLVCFLVVGWVGGMFDDVGLFEYV